MRSVGIGGWVCAAAALAIGCGPSASDPSAPATELVLSGLVAPSARRLDNARAVAVTSTGSSYATYLDAHGAFSLRLPIGASYKLQIANTLPGNGQRVIGHFVTVSSAGATHWFSVRKGGMFDVGTLRSMCGPGHDDDDVGLQGDHDPHGSLGADDDAGKEGDDDNEDDDDMKACTGGGGGSQDGGSTPPPPPAPGTGTTGSPCTTGADCATGFLCAASHCFPAPPVQ